jgi:hypothetical protein
MGGNTFSSPQSLSSDQIADVVDSFGDAYTIYRPIILKNGIDGSVLVEYAALKDTELEGVFLELEVTSVTHKIKLRNFIRSFPVKETGDCHSRSGEVVAAQSLEITNPEKNAIVQSVMKAVTPLKLPEGKYHVFLTHDWGEKSFNHRRVSKVNNILKNKYGLITWFDEDRMEGNIRNKMTEGIENSMTMVIFITAKYQQKIVEGSDDLRDNCKVRNGLTAVFSLFLILLFFLFSLSFNLV